ncbi:MAG TPA: DUF2905 domain-containing protein [Chthoniobacteraceae bacterium]|nr:DUF2905 domain-containing protein [Chthoniobacteraceae bacterium]
MVRGATVNGMQDFGKMLVILGVVIAVAGLILWKFGGFGPLGKLPGDISVQRENFSFSFPIVTCLVISAVLTLVMWLLRR